MTFQLQQETIHVETHRGVRHKLFIMALDDMFKHLEWEEKSINVNRKFLNQFKHTDDVVLIAANATKLQIMIEDFRRTSEKIDE